MITRRTFISAAGLLVAAPSMFLKKAIASPEQKYKSFTDEEMALSMFEWGGKIKFINKNTCYENYYGGNLNPCSYYDNYYEYGKNRMLQDAKLGRIRDIKVSQYSYSWVPKPECYTELYRYVYELSGCTISHKYCMPEAIVTLDLSKALYCAIGHTRFKDSNNIKPELVWERRTDGFWYHSSIDSF